MDQNGEKAIKDVQIVMAAIDTLPVVGHTNATLISMMYGKCNDVLTYLQSAVSKEREIGGDKSESNC